MVDPKEIPDTALKNWEWDYGNWNLMQNCLGFVARLPDVATSSRDPVICTDFCAGPSVPSNETSLCGKPFFFLGFPLKFAMSVVLRYVVL